MPKLNVTAQCDKQMLGGRGARTETVYVLEGRRTKERAALGTRAVKPAMDAVLLPPNKDVCRRGEPAIDGGPSR